MDAYVEDKDVLFKAVFEHLQHVEQQPQALLLDDDLLKRAERSLDASTPQHLLWQLLGTGERLLQLLQQDPRPLTRLLERTVLLIPFDDLKNAISADKLEEGLNSPSVPVQLLCLAYISKAADTPSGASFVAASSSLVKCLVTTWLSSESTEVAERSVEAISALLTVDSPGTLTMIAAEGRMAETQGQGLLWRRIFQDPEVYSVLFEWTSLSSSRRDIKTKKGMQLVTISQARLFDFIVRASQLDWTAITTSSLPEIEDKYVSSSTTIEHPYGGILRYAASHMIDRKDYLMEFLRQDFFVKLLGVVEENNNRNVSQKLLEAIQHEAGVDSTDDGLHL